MTVPPSGSEDTDEPRVRVYVNGSPVEIPRGGDARAAAAAHDPALAAAIAEGSATVTDGRGIDRDPTEPLGTGQILRIIVRARRGEG